MTKRLAVCLPQLEVVRCEYARSLANMMLRLGNVDAGLSQVFTVCGSGSILPSVRQGIASRAIDGVKATHLLWIDADHSFPEDTAHRLLAHGRPWVGVNAASRLPPWHPTASKSEGVLLETTRNSKGLEKVWRMGTGIVLIEARVFEAIPKPWFLNEYIEGADPGSDFRGEDIYFCEKAKAAGFHPMVDHDLTNETTHIGSMGLDTATVLEATQ
jgi:hypothetical protein